jgi:hypothetical protein
MVVHWRMRHYLSIAATTAIVVHVAAVGHDARGEPFNGQHFRGRIAYSADGNYNDPDDWASSPLALAILAAFGLQEKLVHFDYNCILPKADSDWQREAEAKLARLAGLHGLARTTAEWEREHTLGVLGGAERFGYREEVFFDCQRDLEGAVESIRRAIDASSADAPLYFILAGPMEVPYLGIERSDPSKRQYVYCISHNNWNDGYASGGLVEHNKRDLIPLGITWDHGALRRRGHRPVGLRGAPRRLKQPVSSEKDPHGFTLKTANGRQ